MERFAPNTRDSITTNFVLVLICLGLVVCAGCGAEPQMAQDSAASPTVAADIPSPMDIVSRFLDEVRRGGDDSRANDLLTAQARQELARIGQPIQPIGSPDARFEVTRAEMIPEEEGSALVHSLWSEPNQDGTTSQFQVVWAVQRESQGWRISGLAMEIEPNQPPIIIDFENSEMMANLLTPKQPASSSEQSQAAAPAPGISR